MCQNLESDRKVSLVAVKKHRHILNEVGDV